MPKRYGSVLNHNLWSTYNEGERICFAFERWYYFTTENYRKHKIIYFYYLCKVKKKRWLMGWWTTQCSCAFWRFFVLAKVAADNSIHAMRTTIHWRLRKWLMCQKFKWSCRGRVSVHPSLNWVRASGSIHTGLRRRNWAPTRFKARSTKCGMLGPARP